MAVILLTVLTMAWRAEAQSATKCDLEGPTILVQAPIGVGLDPRTTEVDPWGIGGGGHPPPDVTSLAPSTSPSLYVHEDWKVRAAADFDGDGLCDIVWGRTVVENDIAVGVELTLTLTSNETQVPMLREPEPVPRIHELAVGWTLVGSGDFARLPSLGPHATDLGPDGHLDLLLWHAATHTLALWISDGNHDFPETGHFNLAVPQALGTPEVVADLTGERVAGIVWRDAAGMLAYSRLRFAGPAPALQDLTPFDSVGPLTGRWAIRGVSDFDGDGAQDLILQSLINDEVLVWLMAGTSRKSQQYTTPRRLAPPGAPPSTEPTWVVVGPR
jgi:hypothetical protein